MKYSTWLLTVVLAIVIGTLRSGVAAVRFNVIPFEFDPVGTHLVASEWEEGIGCPTNATTTPDGTTAVPNSYTDPACPTGDPSDRRNTGLLLAKTGPTANVAAAGATLKGVRGTAIAELGYDIRKPGAPADSRGSHCGAGAPRFNITLSDGSSFFLGCNSPVAPVQQFVLNSGWLRLRWGVAGVLEALNATTGLPENISGRQVREISILFDEGQDTAPDNFGMAVLDNVDVNGVMVGRGPEEPREKDRDEGEGEDKDHRRFSAHSSASRPESSGLSFNDAMEGVRVQMLDGAKSVSYSGTCVTSVGDALLNEESGYTVTFAACDLSALSTSLTPSIGNYTITVTGPSGVVYQKAEALTAGRVTLHP
jgi:hypothetical protein